MIIQKIICRRRQMMSDDFIKLDIHDKDLTKFLKKLKAKGKNFSPLTAEIASYLYTATDENFDLDVHLYATPHHKNNTRCQTW